MHVGRDRGIDRRHSDEGDLSKIDKVVAKQ